MTSKADSTTADAETGAAAAANEQEASKKLQDDMTHLTAAKDRAQLSSAAAMSILNVGVLGDVIRRGSAYSMYVPLLVMVIVALFLQVVVGIISLRISNMKKYYNVFGITQGFICCKNAGNAGNDDKAQDPQPGVSREVAADANAGNDDKAQDPQPEVSSEVAVEANAIDNGLLKSAGGGAARARMQIREEVELEENNARFNPRQPERIFTVDTSAIYGTKPQPAHNSTGKVKSLQGKSVSRLRDLVVQNLETQEQDLETNVNIRYLENQTKHFESKLGTLKQELEELEAELALEGEMGNEPIRKQQLPVKAKVAELEQSDAAAAATDGPDKDDASDEPDKDAVETRRLKLQQEVDDPTRELDALKHQRALELKGPDYRPIEMRLEDVEKRKLLYFDIRQTEAHLRAIKEEQERQVKQKRWFEIEKEKLELYRAMVDDAQKTNVLKRVMFWQNVINYILYCVSVLNMFITAFSLLSDNDE